MRRLWRGPILQDSLYQQTPYYCHRVIAGAAIQPGGVIIAIPRTLTRVFVPARNLLVLVMDAATPEIRAVITAFKAGGAMEVEVRSKAVQQG